MLLATTGKAEKFVLDGRLDSPRVYTGAKKTPVHAGRRDGPYERVVHTGLKLCASYLSNIRPSSAEKHTNKSHLHVY